MSNNYGTQEPEWSTKSGVRYAKQELVNGLAARVKELEGKYQDPKYSSRKQFIENSIADLNRIINEQCVMFKLKTPKIK